jgi:hypothetical protein
MKRYLLIEKIMRLTRILFMVAMMVACATQSLPAWAQSADSDTAFKQFQTLDKRGKYAEASLSNLAALYEDQRNQLLACAI